MSNEGIGEWALLAAAILEEMSKYQLVVSYHRSNAELDWEQIRLSIEKNPSEAK